MTCAKHPDSFDPDSNFCCKRCSRCGETKSCDDYWKNSQSHDGLQGYCIDCAKQKYKEYVTDNPLAARSRWLRIHNLTLEAFDELLEDQDGRCAICLVALDADSRKYSLHIDHDHACCGNRGSCGSCIRGLLCGSCNHGLGNFRDDPSSLRRAADYLEKERP